MLLDPSLTIGHTQLLLSVGISYLAVVPKEITYGRAWLTNIQQALQVVDMEAHPRVWVGRKGGRKEIRINGTSKMGNGPTQERGPHSCIDQRLTSSNRSSMIGGIKNWSAYVNK